MGSKDRRTPGQKASEERKRQNRIARDENRKQRAAALGIHVDELLRREAIEADARRSRQLLQKVVVSGSSDNRQAARR